MLTTPARVAMLLLMLFVARNASAQTPIPPSTPPDSLERALESATGLERARLLIDLSHTVSAVDVDRAITLSHEAKDLALAVEYWVTIGFHSYGQGDYGPALDAYQNGGLRLAEQTGNLPGQARLLKKQGDLDQSLVHFEDALARSREANDAPQTASSLNNMGITAVRMGQFKASEGYFLRSAQIREQLGETRGYGVIMGNLGELLDAVQAIRNLEGYISPALRPALKQAAGQPDGMRTLSSREKEILALIVHEYTNQQIAETLFISEFTVETHRKNIFRKTGANSLVGLVNFAHSNGLIPDLS